jgi:hypothetical protein
MTFREHHGSLPRVDRDAHHGLLGRQLVHQREPVLAA